MSQSWGSPQWREIEATVAAGGIATIQLNRPDKLNAFTPLMASELMAAFAMAGTDDAIRGIVVTGAGRAFCAGMDLGGEGNVFAIDETRVPDMALLRAGCEGSAGEHLLDLGGRLTRHINSCPKSVAAAINGDAVGVGATMTLAMDFRLASSKARIGFVFNRIGIVPEACSSWLLPRLVGPQRALEWLYLAEPIAAQEALQAGLVRSVHEPGALLEETIELMRRLTAGRSALAQAMTRHLVRRADESAVLEAHFRESLAMHWLSVRDGKEGVAAFLEKRQPHFEGMVSSDLPPQFDSWFQR